MDITISENLRQYRKNKGNTQEELAEHLGISIQAVSKWERNEGFPDITLLPKIAFYYNVSVDDLLGVGKIQMDKKVAEYFEKDDAYQRKGEFDKNRALWAEAFKEFPNNYSVMARYMGWLPDEHSDEKIELAERLLKESDNPHHRHDVICCLSQLYNRLGNEEKAVEYAQKAPGVDASSWCLLTFIYNGEKLVDHVQDNLCCFVDVMDREIYRMMWNGGFDNGERRKGWQRSLKLYDWLYEDGDYGFYNTKVARIYADLALCDAEDGDVDGVINNLNFMAECSIKFLIQESFNRTSFLVNRTVHNSAHKGYPSSTDNECRTRLNMMKRDIFDFCREDERFKEIEIKLAEYAN